MGDIGEGGSTGKGERRGGWGYKYRQRQVKLRALWAVAWKSNSIEVSLKYIHI